MGFLVSQHGQLGAIPPPPFSERFPLGEHSRSGGAIPPPQKGYLSDTCATPYENKANRVRYSPLRYYLERVLRDMGGVSRTGPLRLGTGKGTGKSMRMHLSKLPFIGDFAKGPPLSCTV